MDIDETIKINRLNFYGHGEFEIKQISMLDLRELGMLTRFHYRKARKQGNLLYVLKEEKFAGGNFIIMGEEDFRKINPRIGDKVIRGWNYSYYLERSY